VRLTAAQAAGDAPDRRAMVRRAFGADAPYDLRSWRKR